MRKIFVKLTLIIFDFIYKNQNKTHEKRMNKLKSKVLSSDISGEKNYCTSGATLAIKSKNEKNVNKEKLENIIQNYLKEPIKFFEYIKGAKTQIHILKHAKKLLSFIDENEGFIYPKTGFKAFYLNLILNKKIGFKTPEMFVLSSYNINVYAFIYQFYNWYCYKMKLNGFESDTQDKFKHVFEFCETPKINTLSYEEIIALKTAIRRDIEAIEFVKNIVVKNSMAKKNLNKIKQGKKVNI